MSMPDPIPPVRPQLSFKVVMGMVTRVLGVLIILAALLFLPAGRWNWVDAWLFLIAYGAFLFVYSAWGLWKDPQQLNERSHIAQNVKPWDKVILTIYTAFLMIAFILAGIDAGRFHWSTVPLPVKVIAWCGLAAAGTVIFWSLATNTYLSRYARIQNDREQVVISNGPYRYVRHPMYLGIILMFFCVPLVLGSWWAVIPGAVIACLFVVRTSKEDKMLRQELAGYETYSKSVRYRLFPHVW